MSEQKPVDQNSTYVTYLAAMNSVPPQSTSDGFNQAPNYYQNQPYQSQLPVYGSSQLSYPPASQYQHPGGEFIPNPNFGNPVYSAYDPNSENQQNEEQSYGRGRGGHRGGRGGNRGNEPREPPPQDTIYFSGLGEDIDEKSLAEKFGSIGIIKTDKKTGAYKIHIYRNKETGLPKGDGTITYEDPMACEGVIKYFNGTDYHGRKLSVSLAERKDNFQSPFGGRGGRGGFRGGRGGDRGGRGGGRGGGGPVFQEGDWPCPACGNINWARKTHCNMCKAPKPGNLPGGPPSQRGGYGRGDSGYGHGGDSGGYGRGGDRGGFDRDNRRDDRGDDRNDRRDDRKDDRRDDRRGDDRRWNDKPDDRSSRRDDERRDDRRDRRDRPY